MKKYLPYSPLLIAVFLAVLFEVMSFVLDDQALAYTADHIVIYVLVFVAYYLITFNDHIQSLHTQLLNNSEIIADYHSQHYNILKLVRYGHVAFRPQDFPKVWSELMWDSQDEFLSCNYLSSAALWDHRFSHSALLIQQAKIQNSKAHMRRIFVYDDDADYEELKDTLAANVKAGIEVHTIRKDALYKTPYDGYFSTRSQYRIETIAFNLIDGIALLLFDIKTGSRDIQTFKLVLDKELYKHYRQFYMDVCNNTDVYSVNE